MDSTRMMMMIVIWIDDFKPEVRRSRVAEGESHRE